MKINIKRVLIPIIIFVSFFIGYMISPGSGRKTMMDTEIREHKKDDPDLSQGHHDQ